MKITTNDGTVFEGTQSEYEAFLAFAKKELAEQEDKQAQTDTEQWQRGEVEGVIEFEGAKYRKVDRKAQAGDVVVLTGDELPEWFTKGKAYKVNGNSEITDDSGEYDNYVIYSEKYGRTSETVDVYEKVEAEYVPQDGDIVVVVSAPDPRLAVGDIGKVEHNQGTFRVVVPGKVSAANWQTAEDVRKATPAEVEAYGKAVADASKPKLKAGDFVTIDTDLIAEDITTDKVYEVFENSYGLYFLDDIDDERYNALEVGAYTIVDAEDLKWAKIGRKVGEIREGDVVKVVSGEGKHPIGTVGIAKESGNTSSTAVVANGISISTWCNVELIAPVESTFK